MKNKIRYWLRCLRGLNKPIYVITCFSDLPSKENDNTFGAGRSFGYYHSFKEAHEAVLRNCCDLHEYLYTYCFIERIEPGIHALCLPEDRTFYIYDTTLEQWRQHVEPTYMCGIINLSIG